MKKARRADKVEWTVARLRRSPVRALTYTYKVVSGGSCTGGTDCVRLSSVNNNSGYQLKIEYANNSTASDNPTDGWQTVSKVTAVNNAFEYCSPSADTCTFSGTYHWSSASYAHPSTYVYTTTDQDSRVTTLTFDSGGQITGIELPGSGSNDVTVAYSSGAVTSVTTAVGAWSYAQSCPASCTTTVTDPGSHNTVYGFDPNAGQISSVTDALGRASNRTFLNDGSGRVATSTTPAGVTPTTPSAA